MDLLGVFAVGMVSTFLILSIMRVLLHHSARSSNSTSIPSAREGKALLGEDPRNQRFTCTNQACVGFDKWYRPTAAYWTNYRKYGVPPICVDCGKDLTYVGETSHS